MEKDQIRTIALQIKYKNSTRNQHKVSLLLGIR